MAITLAEAQGYLAEALAARSAVLAGQSYEIREGESSKKLTRADLAAINADIAVWQTKVTRLERGGGIRVRGVYRQS